jgi:protein ImuB
VMRTLAVWCPDWPVTVAGVDPSRPAIVLAANRVVAASAAARADGVAEGQRRRDAQRRSPDARLLRRNLTAEVSAFERVVAALGEICPEVEVSRPGLAAFATRGPSRYFGGDEALAVRVGAVLRALGRRQGWVEEPTWWRIGVADGPFAARLAAMSTRGGGPKRDAGPPTDAGSPRSAGSSRGARFTGHAHHQAGLVVPPGAAARFLAAFPVRSLESPELCDVLGRLGICRLGQLASLDGRAVQERFGPEGAAAWRLARGEDRATLAPQAIPPDLEVWTELDPPVDQVDRAAFVARSLAVELHDRLSAHGLACRGVRVEVETDNAERCVRRWRHDRPLTVESLVERVRWQLESWLAGSGPLSPTAGLALLRLAAEEVERSRGSQPGLWGGDAEPDRRAERALARVQGMLGPEAVCTAVRSGGRGPSEQVRLVPWGEPREPAHPPDRPWPGRLPPPSPALVYPTPVLADLLGTRGTVVGVDGRGQLRGQPASLRWGSSPLGPGAGRLGTGTGRLGTGTGQRGTGRLAAVTWWAGPWPVEERWWDATGRRRVARLQVLLEDESAHLLVLERGQWAVEASYD